MRCHEVRKLFPLYYDSEGDAEMQLQIGDHLGLCPQCKEVFERQARYEDALVGALANGEPSPEMWKRIERRTLEMKRPRKRFAIFQLGSGRLVALAVGLLVILSAWQLTSSDHSDGHLSQLAATAHQLYVSGGWQAEVQSESVEELEQALRSRAGFAVRCPPQGQAGFRLKGGGMCRLGSHQAVHFVGDVQGRAVSMIVLPGKCLQAFPHMRRHLSAEGQTHRCREGRYEMVASRLHGHLVVVLGEVNPDVLESILLGYGRHHAAVVPQPSPVGELRFGEPRSGRQYDIRMTPLATELAISVK